MARTTVRTEQIEDGGVRREDLNTSTSGQAVIRKVLEGTGIQLTSTGVDSGTGDVTIATRPASSSQAGHVTSSAQTFGGAKTFDAAYISSEINLGSSGSGTINVQWDLGNCQKLTMTGNCTFTFSNGVAGGRYLLELIEDATGSRNPTWPSSVKWSGGAVPILSGANKIDLIAFYFDGTNYLGNYSLNY